MPQALQRRATRDQDTNTFVIAAPPRRRMAAQIRNGKTVYSRCYRAAGNGPANPRRSSTGRRPAATRRSHAPWRGAMLERRVSSTGAINTAPELTGPPERAVASSTAGYRRLSSQPDRGADHARRRAAILRPNAWQNRLFEPPCSGESGMLTTASSVLPAAMQTATAGDSFRRHIVSPRKCRPRPPAAPASPVPQPRGRDRVGGFQRDCSAEERHREAKLRHDDGGGGGGGNRHDR